LQSLDAFVEVNDECLILSLAQHLTKKPITRATLLIQYSGLAPARVNQKPDGKRKTRLLREVSDLLLDTVFLERKVVCVQVLDNPPISIMNRCQKRNDVNVYR
jgi:hypothetical protein